MRGIPQGMCARISEKLSSVYALNTSRMGGSENSFAKHPAGVTLYPTEQNFYPDQYEIIVLRIIFSEDFLFVTIKTIQRLQHCLTQKEESGGGLQIHAAEQNMSF